MAGSNKSKIKGDNNKVIQGLTAGRDIILYFEKDLDPKVRKEKEELFSLIEKQVEELRKIEQKSTGDSDASDKTKKPNNPNYEKIDWPRLVKAIKRKRCVLFIGPEISVDEKGKSLHQNFYNKMADENDHVDYMEDEGFFSPGADDAIGLDAMDYYEEDFPKQNKIGRGILEKFAQIPFDLIISLCPDDTIHHVYNDFNREHQFYVYDATKKEIDIHNNDNPIVYNMLGNAAKNGKYIFTHENYFNYLKEFFIPSEIKQKIQDADHLFFIGFDFNKWYNRLLFFVLKFETMNRNSRRLKIDKKSVAKQFKEYIEKQFSITSAHNDYEEFATWLVQNARKEEGIVINLSERFIKSTFETLEQLGRDLNDAEKFKQLDPIQAGAKNTSAKIESFKQLIG